MKIVALLSVLLTSVFANADIIKCSFTEPFLNVTYSMTQSKLTVVEEVMGKKTVTKNVSFQIKAAGTFELFDKNNNVIMTLSLDNKGSDGMSQTVFPYTATFTDKANWANGGVGGCTSNYLASTPGEN